MSQKIFLPKWADLLIALYNSSEEQRYCGRLHKQTGITTRHLRSLIDDLEKMNIISVQSRGKIKYIKLTETGTKLAESLVKIYPALKCNFDKVKK